MVSRFVALIALLVSSSQVLAADPDGNYSVRGVGLVDCAAFTQERARKSPAYQMIGGFIDGYLTGANASLASTYDVMSYQSTELLAEVIAQHCAANPEHRLFEVLASIARQTLPDRLQTASPLNKIVVGEKETYLYSETVQRMQTALVDLGHLQGDNVSGKFNPATASALAAFQTSVRFQSTGFPDQATLWKLFES